MHVRCSYCRHSFNLSRDYLVEAVNKAVEKRQKYHAIECANCRKLIKVPLRQMQRYMPRVEEVDEAEGENPDRSVD